MLAVMRSCLEGDSVACQESAVLGWVNWSGSFDETSEYAQVEDRVLGLKTSITQGLF
jgi:hypothetical protein